jgi:hypothetical protein
MVAVAEAIHMPKLVIFFALVFIAPFIYSPANAHGGGLNAEGCHNNNKTGDYHCHRAPAAKPAQKPVEPSNATGNPTGPTCYTGPRGGTYTITPSGRKNYKGC